MYRCLNCKKIIEEEKKAKRLRCPYCGFRIMVKTDAVSPRKVKAR